MVPLPINAHPRTEVSDSCNCCNPIKILISRSNTKIKTSDDKLTDVERRVKEKGSTIISTNTKMVEKQRKIPDVREMW